MPTLLREGPYRFFFYSADCAEPAHVHVQRDDRIAKLWLHDAGVASTDRFAASELGRIIKLVRERKKFLTERWNDCCRG